MASQIPVSYTVSKYDDILYRSSNRTHTSRRQLTPGINIFDTDIDNIHFFLELKPGQEFLSDTVFDNHEFLASLIREENTLYFIRLVGNEHIKNMCMINYNPKLNPNWNCKICTFINSYKDRCEMCNTPKPRFRSYRKKLGKTKRSKSRSKRSKSIH